MSPKNILVEISEIPVRKEGRNSGRLLSFCVEEPDFILVVGPNGSGKTYILNLIAALTLPNTGEVIIEGRSLEIMEESEKLAWRRTLGLIPSHSNLFNSYTVLENLRLSAQLLGIKPKEAIEYSKESAELCGLSKYLEEKVESLSEGLRKRVVIARALVGRPKMILADNPLEGLDEISQEQFLYLCTKLAKIGYSVVMTTSVPLPFDIKSLRVIDLGGG